jgi:hypothetical protein
VLIRRVTSSNGGSARRSNEERLARSDDRFFRAMPYVRQNRISVGRDGRIFSDFRQLN